MDGFTGDHNMGNNWIKSKTCDETGGCLVKDNQSDEQMLFTITITNALSVHLACWWFVEITVYSLNYNLLDCTKNKMDDV